jgi:hypothetical protein
MYYKNPLECLRHPSGFRPPCSILARENLRFSRCIPFPFTRHSQGLHGTKETERGRKPPLHYADALHGGGRALIMARATSAGISASGYVRSMALTGQVVVVQSVLPDYALVEQWRRVGVNLNQLTHLANAGKDLPRDELIQVLAQVEALLDYGMGIAS